jgi:hypothetical protein
MRYCYLICHLILSLLIASSGIDIIDQLDIAQGLEELL